jgi:rhodanese-related sulfurtransferase
MKKSIEFISFFCFYLFLLFIPIHADKILSVKKKSFDFGTVQEGIHVPVSFVIANSGTTTVKLKQIRTFASCVQSRPISNKRLKPGKSVKLEFIFESLGYGGISVNKLIEIHYNNPDSSPLQLRVQGEVTPLQSFQAPLGEIVYNFFVFIDLRSKDQFKKEHIIGAINIPAENIEQWVKKNAKRLSSEMIIYLFSKDGKVSDRMAHKLQEDGYMPFISIVGGLKEWKRQYGTKWLISGKF